MRRRRRKLTFVSKRSVGIPENVASSVHDLPTRCPDQGNRIRPGALLVPVCVWQLLQSPDVCIADSVSSRLPDDQLKPEL